MRRCCLYWNHSWYKLEIVDGPTQAVKSLRGIVKFAALDIEELRDGVFRDTVCG